jgi:hypothetical protein
MVRTKPALDSIRNGGRLLEKIVHQQNISTMISARLERIAVQYALVWTCQTIAGKFRHRLKEAHS